MVPAIRMTTPALGHNLREEILEHTTCGKDSSKKKALPQNKIHGILL